MPEPSIRMTKIWEDFDFYEIRMEFEGNYCSVLYIFTPQMKTLKNLDKRLKISAT
jgi:hypothetical protein